MISRLRAVTDRIEVYHRAVRETETAAGYHAKEREEIIASLVDLGIMVSVARKEAARTCLTGELAISEHNALVAWARQAAERIVEQERRLKVHGEIAERDDARMKAYEARTNIVEAALAECRAKTLEEVATWAESPNNGAVCSGVAAHCRALAAEPLR